MTQPQLDQIDLTEAEPGRLRLTLPATVDSRTVSSMLTTIQDQLANRAFRSVDVDCRNIQSFNDFGVLCLLEIKRLASDRAAEFSLRNVPERMQAMLDMVGFSSLHGRTSLPAKKEPSFLIRLGEATIWLAQDIRDMIAFVGEVLLCLKDLLRHPGRLRRSEFLGAMYQIGVNALPIVFLINFLLGLILAFMSSFQLRQFGADIYVASLVALAMVKELGPIMTSIIVAGRSGSAFAAEIGSMMVSEEIDALTTMGLNPTLFLVMPKLLAAVLVVPFLVLFANLFGIAGGLVVGVGMLDLSIQGYVQQTIQSLRLFDFILGFAKGGLFALLITWIGCFRGFQTRGGASGVGRSTTSAVVSGIFLIILADSLLAVILKYWGL